MCEFVELPDLFDDCPVITTEYSDNDRDVDDKIRNAESVEELVSIISDELVRSIREQLQLK